MKKIVQIVSGYREGDGIGNVAVARAQALLQLGCAVTVICQETEPAQLQRPDGPAIQVLPGPLDHFSGAPEPLRQIVREADVLVVDIGGYSPLLHLVELRCGRVVVDYHAMTPPELVRETGYYHLYFRGLALIRRLLPFIDVLACDSAYNRAEWERLFGAQPAVREVVSLFGNAQPVEQPTFVATAGRPLELLMVGRMFPNKNLGTAIRAVDRLRARQVEARLSHIGGGNDSVAWEYRAQVERLIAGLKLQDRVRLRGVVPHGDLVQAYRTCDALLLPSLHEGFSLPALEAMAYGKPVFGARLGALPDTLGGAGILFNPFDADELADALVKHFAQDETARRSHAEQAVARAKQFTRQAFCDRYVELILQPGVVAPLPTTPWSPADGAAATVTVEPRGSMTGPQFRGLARIGGLTRPLPPEIRLTAHLFDAAGILLQYDERPQQTWSGAPTAPEIAFELLTARAERPHTAVFQLVDPRGGAPELFGRPQVLAWAGRDGAPQMADQAQQILALMQQLADLNFSLTYPTGSLVQKIKAFVARNVTSRLQNRYLQPHVELQTEINRQFVDLLRLIVQQSGRPSE